MSVHKKHKSEVIFFQPETQSTVLSAILGTTQDVTTPGTGHTQRFAMGHDDHEHQRFLMEKLVIVTTPMVTRMRWIHRYAWKM